MAKNNCFFSFAEKKSCLREMAVCNNDNIQIYVIVSQIDANLIFIALFQISRLVPLLKIHHNIAPNDLFWLRKITKLWVHYLKFLLSMLSK